MKRSAPEARTIPSQAKGKAGAWISQHGSAGIHRCGDTPAPRAAGSVPRAGNSAGILLPRRARFHLPAGLRAPIPVGNATGISCAAGKSPRQARLSSFVFAKQPEILARKGPVE